MDLIGSENCDGCTMNTAIDAICNFGFKYHPGLSGRVSVGCYRNLLKSPATQSALRLEILPSGKFRGRVLVENQPDLRHDLKRQDFGGLGEPRQLEDLTPQAPQQSLPGRSRIRMTKLFQLLVDGFRRGGFDEVFDVFWS